MRGTPQTIYLKDYQAPHFAVESVKLHFALDPTKTVVTNQMRLKRLPNANTNDLSLDGEALSLLSVTLNDKRLTDADYDVTEETLIVKSVPDEFELTIETQINPSDNKTLSGLYISNGIFCTQCEAHGFRRITYFMDRPDVLSRYTTTISASKKDYPILLSNGNPTHQGENDDGTHWVTWEDPFKKPSYLFALVAGDLAHVEDTYQTMSGRDVACRLFVEKGNEDKCQHALDSLMNAMRWDEQNFGREYDLDIYMIVAVSAFNMGAMENKGLNIFNDHYVLASPETATDTDYQQIESVIAHEYFHNWTGNRITCRDWFQLSLKEGLTVYRDQEFSRDMQSDSVMRIQDVQVLRTHQFREDSGPMAHPVQPSSYIEVNNFYTSTVYNKGAEVIRMLRTFLGKEGFRQGMDLYFERHDGQAVTIEDFVAAIANANEFDATQFKRWYTQSGTPEVSVTSDYDPEKASLTLTLEQSCPPTPGQKEKSPFHFPVVIGVLDAEGKVQNVSSPDLFRQSGDDYILEMKDERQAFTFYDVNEPPVVSFLRGFSAPVKVNFNRRLNDHYTLLAYDSDGFTRFEAGQQLMIQRLQAMLTAWLEQKTIPWDSRFSDAFLSLLEDGSLDPALVSLALTLPNEIYLADCLQPMDVDGIHGVRRQLFKDMARELKSFFKSCYERTQTLIEAKSGPLSGLRSLKNTCLVYLAGTEEPEFLNLAVTQFHQANNMTDELATLNALNQVDCVERETVLSQFFEKWQNEHLVLDKWFSVQARSSLPNALDKVIALTQHSAFDWTNPNRVRAVIGTFCGANLVHFHRIDGAGYQFLADAIGRLNKMNPQIAARLVSPLSQWRRYDDKRQALMKQTLEDLRQQDLAKDVFEMVTKSLN
jgi:aminopeptidase N